MSEVTDATIGTAVVVTYNSARTIEACLATLRAACGPAWRIVVVDNRSADDTVARVRATPDVELIANDDNRGLSAANNQGIAAATGRFVLLCNPDIEPWPESVDAMVACADRHERAAFVIPRLVTAEGDGQVSVGTLPSLGRAMLGMSFSLRQRGGEDSPETWWQDWAHDVERSVGHGMECCYLVRRSAIAEIGPQDERFWLDWEGVDWAERVWDGGWEVWFTPDAVIVHEGGASIASLKVRWIRETHKGLYRYFAKRSPRPLRPVLAAAVTARMLTKLAVHAARFQVYRNMGKASEKAPPPFRVEPRS